MIQDREYLVAVLAVVAAPILTFALGIFRARWLGITKSNAAEILDRAKFRKSLLERQEQLEKQVDASRREADEARQAERKLIEESFRLQNQLNDAYRRIEDLEDQVGSKDVDRGLMIELKPERDSE